MSTAPQAWIGRCQYRDGESDFETAVAVWADARAGFDAALRDALTHADRALIWSEDALPIPQWLARHGHNTETIALAKTVHHGHRIAFGKASGITATTPAKNNYLLIEEIEGVAPLDDQFGIANKKTVPDALYALLFGQPDPTDEDITLYGNAKALPPLKTYAILDAAKIDMLPELLASSNLAHRCLFKGEAQIDMGDLAPWIVELDHGESLLRALLTRPGDPEALTGYWDTEPGLFVRSRASLDDLWRHLRHFTKIRDESGQWYYLRFWEGAWVLDCFDMLGEAFGHRFYKPINAVLKVMAGTVYHAIPVAPPVTPPAGPMVLPNWSVLAAQRRGCLVRRVQKRLLWHHGDDQWFAHAKSLIEMNVTDETVLMSLLDLIVAQDIPVSRIERSDHILAKPIRDSAKYDQFREEIMAGKSRTRIRL